MSYGVGSVEKNGNLANMRLAYSGDGTAVYKPLMMPTTTTTDTPNFQQHQTLVPGGLTMNSGEPMKRKRGRPRKYAPDADGVTMALHLLASQPPQQQQQPVSVSVSVEPTSSASVATKKGRGRPPGSGRKQHPSSSPTSALGSAGVGFTPHVISVKAGEDVLAKIMSFSQNGPRTVCILSANGAISNVTLRQAATSGGTVTYEGRFEILSLSGSFLLSEIGGQRSRTGGLSVLLAGSDGRVLGGGVAGLLTAASPVQVIVGSFIAEGRKESKSGNQSEPLFAPAKLVPGTSKAGSPPSHGTLSESSGGPASPLNQSAGGCNNTNPQGLANMPWK